MNIIQIGSNSIIIQIEVDCDNSVNHNTNKHNKNKNKNKNNKDDELSLFVEYYAFSDTVDIDEKNDYMNMIDIDINWTVISITNTSTKYPTIQQCTINNLTPNTRYQIRAKSQYNINKSTNKKKKKKNLENDESGDSNDNTNNFNNLNDSNKYGYSRVLLFKTKDNPLELSHISSFDTTIIKGHTQLESNIIYKYDILKIAKNGYLTVKEWNPQTKTVLSLSLNNGVKKIQCFIRGFLESKLLSEMKRLKVDFK